jgi:hypothetical protein
MSTQIAGIFDPRVGWPRGVDDSVPERVAVGTDGVAPAVPAQLDTLTSLNAVPGNAIGACGVRAITEPNPIRQRLTRVHDSECRTVTDLVGLRRRQQPHR